MSFRPSDSLSELEAMTALKNYILDVRAWMREDMLWLNDVFAGVLFVHQPDANRAPGASVTQVNHSVHTLSTFLRIREDPSMQIF